MLPVKRFKEFVETNALFAPGDRVLAAVSGGMDSVLMVHLLKAAGYSFGLAHCNFQLRGDESMRDQEFCHLLAQSLRVPFHCIHFDTKSYAETHKISTQMAARQLRYQWFEQVRQQSGYQVIALAHHQNDAIETILLNLTRGTGIAGLHGILSKNGSLVRPMLGFSREEIDKLISENKISFVEDSSNSSTKYARNKIRMGVVPKLKELNPALEETFENNLQRFRELEQLLQNETAHLKNSLFEYRDNEICIEIEAIKRLDPRRLLLYNLLKEYGVSEAMVEDLISVLDKHAGRVFETPGYQLLVDRGKLIITPLHQEGFDEAAIPPGVPGINYGRYKLNILHDDSPLIVKDNPMAVSVDSDLLIYPLILRGWRQGDVFQPLGMKGKKKLSDFFVGEKIPLHKKAQIPLLINGNGDIIWVGGHRPDERYKVSAKTKKVTIFELVLI